MKFKRKLTPAEIRRQKEIDALAKRDREKIHGKVKTLKGAVLEFGCLALIGIIIGLSLYYQI